MKKKGFKDLFVTKGGCHPIGSRLRFLQVVEKRKELIQAALRRLDELHEGRWGDKDKYRPKKRE